MLWNYYLAQKLAESHMRDLLGEAEAHRFARAIPSRPEAKRWALWAWRVGGAGGAGLLLWGLISAIRSTE
jgi:hypothetical protein